MHYTVLNDVSEALRQLLAEEFAAEQPIPGAAIGEGSIGFANPPTADLNSIRLSLWLYQVVENEFLKNQPPEPINGSDQRRMPPLPLNLYFLVTPLVDDPTAQLQLLGKTMQVLYDNAIVVLRDPLPPNLTDELRIILCRLTLEELTRIWEALREPYRLSVCYQVRVTRIDSRRDFNGARVIERNAGFGQAPLLAAG
jgi:hypothetical protein